MHNTESVLKNETYKPFWDFEIQTDQLISARRPDLVIVNNNNNKKKKKEEKKRKEKKENLSNSRICRSGGSQNKIKRKLQAN